VGGVHNSSINIPFRQKSCTEKGPGRVCDVQKQHGKVFLYFSETRSGSTSVKKFIDVRQSIYFCGESWVRSIEM
jgi:hypothetical protein